MEILYITTGKIVVKGVANHASNSYEFSHFLPYSAPTQCQKPFEREGKNSLSYPFADNDMLSKISFLEDEEQYRHDLDIKIIPQDDLDPYPPPIPNQNPKWPKNLIKAVGNGAGNIDDRRRMRSQYQNEHVALSHTTSLPTDRFIKLPERCYLLMKIDQQFGPLMNKMDHSIPPPERRDKRNIQQIERRWKGSHAQSQDVDAQKNHDSA